MYRSSPFRSTLNTSYITGLGMWSMYRSSPFRSTLNTSYITALGMWSMYRSSPFRSTFSTSYITALDMSEVSTEAVHSVALWTRVTSQLWACVKYVPKQSIQQHFQHELHHSFGHVWSIYRSSPFRIALWTRVTSQVWTCVKYLSSPFRSTLNTSYITGLGMCEVYTQAVHSVALWTRVTSQLWACVKYVPKQSIP